MLSIWPLLAILLLTLRLSVQGYMIDDDCGDDTQFVRDRVDAAFRLIDNAVTELRKTPLDQRIDDWHNTLFGRRYDANAESSQNIRTRLEQLLVVRDYNSHDQTRPLVTDVRFYCTTKRIEKVGTVYKNKDRGIDYKEGEAKHPGGRFAHCYDTTPPTLMITFTVSITQYSEIQICPWFLSYARGYKVKDMSSLPASIFTAISKIAIPIAARTAYTLIDVFSLMDKTIVHELTHADQHIPTLRDVDPDPYGFKNAMKKADKYRQDRTQPDPLANADNNSLFAVGAWIIAKGGGPINRDGTFGAPQSTPKAKM